MRRGQERGEARSGAIVGPVRGDIFFGTGDKAGEHAGVMNAKGRYFVLVPRGVKAGEKGRISGCWA